MMRYRSGRRRPSWLATSLRQEAGETQGTDSGLVARKNGRLRLPGRDQVPEVGLRFPEGVTNCSGGLWGCSLGVTHEAFNIGMSLPGEAVMDNDKLIEIMERNILKIKCFNSTDASTCGGRT